MSRALTIILCTTLTACGACGGASPAASGPEAPPPGASSQAGPAPATAASDDPAGAGPTAPPVTGRSAPAAGADPCDAVPATEPALRAACRQAVDHPWFAPPNADDPAACRPPVDAAWLTCERDTDCVAVALSDCGSCNGGAAAAVHRAHRDRMSGLRDACSAHVRNCTEMACAQDEPAVACVAGACAVVQRPTGPYCSDDAPCDAGEECRARGDRCGGGRQCLPAGHRWADDPGCGFESVH